MRFLKPLKFVLKAIIPPETFIKFLIWKRGYPEPELRLIKILSNKEKISIDVGASEGLYTAHLYLNSRKCVAFEPRKEASDELKKLTRGLNPPIQIESVALSDFTGNAELKVFARDAGRSTIEKNNLIENEGQIEIISTTVKKLDDYIFEDAVGFIKIDVEGQEEFVLRGAEQLLKSDHPILLVEIEERHRKNSVKNVKMFLEGLGYKGYYLKKEHLKDMDGFNIDMNQNINSLNNKAEYTNNFVFFYKNMEKNFSNLFS